jgi:hypothetical protein
MATTGDELISELRSHRKLLTRVLVALCAVCFLVLIFGIRYWYVTARNEARTQIFRLREELRDYPGAGPHHQELEDRLRSLENSWGESR